MIELLLIRQSVEAAYFPLMLSLQLVCFCAIEKAFWIVVTDLGLIESERVEKSVIFELFVEFDVRNLLSHLALLALLYKAVHQLARLV